MKPRLPRRKGTSSRHQMRYISLRITGINPVAKFTCGKLSEIHPFQSQYALFPRFDSRKIPKTCKIRTTADRSHGASISLSPAALYLPGPVSWCGVAAAGAVGPAGAGAVCATNSERRANPPTTLRAPVEA